MPRGDGTGPFGQGPMTGRRLGYCGGYPTPGFTKGYGAGWGAGRRGPGFGWGRGAYPVNYAPPAPVAPEWDEEQEVKMLKAQATAIESQLKAIQDRIRQLTSKNEE